jgi:hypothetical protein
MDTWTKWTEFLACGLFVLPATLGLGLGSFEVFAVTLGLMQILFVTLSLGAPTVTIPTKSEKNPSRRQQ